MTPEEIRMIAANLREDSIKNHYRFWVVESSRISLLSYADLLEAVREMKKEDDELPYRPYAFDLTKVYKLAGCE